MTSWLDELAIGIRNSTKASGAWLVMLAVCSLGCMDGPLHALKRANPYFQKQWAADRALGPTFDDRLQELRLLDSKIATMTPEEQDRWATTLAQLMQKEPSAEMRAQIAITVANVKSPTAQQTLNLASTDEVEKVRLAACKAWKRQETEVASLGLLRLARSDESIHVRQSAIDSLANFDSQDARTALAEFLDDRSPAIQFHSAAALQKMTGRNYGGDFEAWKRFVAGEEVPEPAAPSMTARIINALPLPR